MPDIRRTPALGSGGGGVAGVSTVNGDSGEVTISVSDLPITKRSTGSSTALTDGDDVLEATTASVVLTLHDATTALVKRYDLRNSSVGNISFATTASQTVVGSTTGTIFPGQSVTVVPSNGNWIIV